MRPINALEIVAGEDQFGRAVAPFGLECKDVSLTVQSDAIDADINTIVKRFGITGQFPTNLPYVTNVDLTLAPDTFQGALEVLERAREAFMALPANVRSRFNNDPGAFVDFCSIPENLPEMRKLGLAVPEPEAPRAAPVMDVRIVDAPISSEDSSDTPQARPRRR